MRGKVVSDTEISNGKSGGSEKAGCPSADTRGGSGLSPHLIWIDMPEGKTKGLLVKECAEIGVIRSTCASGCAMGPPAARL
tara:strand:+ start:645 stop:887 length:243 start_codon:yes stop_codon:yes gene_type:complete